MDELRLPSGETIQYDYNARGDVLDIRLRTTGAAGELEPLADIPRVRVRRDPGSGEVVALEVSGVQALILEHLVRDLVATARATARAEHVPATADREPGTVASAPLSDAAGAPSAAPAPAPIEPSGVAAPIEPSGVAAPIEPSGVTSAPVTLPARETEPARGALPSEDDRRARRPRRGDRRRASDGADAPPPDRETVPLELETPSGFRFAGLDPRLGAAVAAAGYEEPTPIQLRAMPPALAGRDLVGLAQTGTGKTAAFLLPALQRLLAAPDAPHRPRALVVTPTRELAVQVGEQAELLARFTSLRVAIVYGGAAMPAQVRALRQGVDVIVATPGRLLDHVRQRNVNLDAVEVLVLDESDRMLDMGFLPDVRRIIEHLPEARQTLLFGATLPPDIESLSRRFQSDPEVVEVARQLPPATLEQALYPVGKHLKIPLLIHLLKGDTALSRVLVFTETKVETDIVARKVAEAGVRVAEMHGDRPQKDRERALQQLKSGEVQALIATNVAARGLDIEDVSHVINYDMPQSVDDYVHRVGRTARGVADGVAYTFVTSSDEGMVLRIQSALGQELRRVMAEGFDYDVPTPSWAQPSSRDLARALHPPSLANLSRAFVRKRR